MARGGGHLSALGFPPPFLPSSFSLSLPPYFSSPPLLLLISSVVGIPYPALEHAMDGYFQAGNILFNGHSGNEERMGFSFLYCMITRGCGDGWMEVGREGGMETFPSPLFFSSRMKAAKHCFVFLASLSVETALNSKMSKVYTQHELRS